MRVKYVNGSDIAPWEDVRVIKMEHILECKYIASDRRGAKNIIRVDKDHYKRIGSDEIYEFQHIENRGEDKKSLKVTFHKIRLLINNNFKGLSNELHITLTYAENMKDTEKLYKDIVLFIKKLKYKYGKLEYLIIIEPQERGAFHAHVLIKFTEKDKIYIPSNELAKIWGHGFIKIKSIKGVDNIGVYLSAYLTDVVLEDDTINKNEKVKFATIDGKTKRIIKGARVRLYPPGINIYRHSKGIVFPEQTEMKYSEFKRIVGNLTPDYSKTVYIQNDDGKTVQTVIYEYYNMKRTIKKINEKKLPLFWREYVT
jgi:hypothetical protein